MGRGYDWGGTPPNPADQRIGAKWAAENTHEVRSASPIKFRPNHLDTCRRQLKAEVLLVARCGSCEHHFKTPFAHDDAEAEAAIQAVLLELGYGVQKRSFSRGTTAGLGFYITWY